MTDIEIANSVKPAKIKNIAKALGLSTRSLITYGDYKAKINLKKSTKETKKKLVLVTAK